MTTVPNPSAYDRSSPHRFPPAVDNILRTAGWHPGRWDIRRAESWADELRAHASPGGHRHQVFPAAVEAWAEFGTLRITGPGPGLHVAPPAFIIDPSHGRHLARTLADLGRSLDTEVAPLGAETSGEGHTPAAVLAIDAEGRVYALDHSGDYYLGADIDAALAALITGTLPARLPS
ncbi:SUKH-3 domain containing protein [Streptomyces sp. A7024]|uniref:SUKH-3 domain containing protein n=1 Tax=Streptomyces coryli TaxID=1128680 RepID=A0A6G4UD29_9ACTN|nr:SUKH-3 domain containing protein [Streptomyces coryli]